MSTNTRPNNSRPQLQNPTEGFSKVSGLRINKDQSELINMAVKWCLKYLKVLDSFKNS